MADSTLDMTGEATPVTTLGHGTGALGPSDSSDSGSDVLGGPGMDEGLSDDQSREMPQTIHTSAGRDLGDVGLDSDTDRAGTGERGASGVDDAIAVDQMMTVQDDVDVGADEPEAPVVVTADLDLITAVEDDDRDEAEEALDDVPASDGAT